MTHAPKILAFSGSTRSGSHNTRLLGAGVAELAKLDCEVTWISLEDYPLPLYNGDLESAKGVPENAFTLARMLHEHDGLLIATPEYNGSITPLTKNTLDWISRVSSDKKGPVQPFRGKIAAILSASPGKMGGISMLYHLRDVLVRLGAVVISEQVAVGDAASAFDETDRLSDERTAGFLAGLCKSLAEKAEALGNVHDRG